MKKTTLLIVAIIMASIFVSATPIGNVIVVGANGIPDNTAYLTLKEAFDAINGQPDQTGKTIEIQIAASTTETATAALNQPTTATWTSLTIYPTANNVTIGGVISSNLIDLNGADKVTIIGKLNKTGTEKMLSITNTGAGSGIRLIADAMNNNISYCKLAAANPSNLGGVILFGDAKSTLGEGNDNNTIEYCDINAAGSANGIKASSANAFPSEGNIIRNNNIFDFYISNASTTATAGIDVSTNYTTSTINGNSLYQTAARAYSATSTLHLGINVGGTSNGNNISDNYIGGSAPLCGGTAWTVTGGLYRLFAMQYSFGTTTPVSSIQNNTISNLDITTEVIANASSAFIGFQHGGTGSANYGTTTGNTIGSITSIGAIKLKYTGATVGSLNVGFNIAGGAVTISNNKIGGIIVDLNNSANRAHFYGISTAGALLITINKNIIGSETIANSIEHKGSTTPTGSQGNLRGLNIGNTGGSVIEENVIANLTCSSTGAGMTTNGIYTNSQATNQSVSKNIIRNITSYSSRTSTGATASLIGMLLNFGSGGSGHSVSGNTVHTLNNATATADGVEGYGIYFETTNTGTPSIIEKNKIYGVTTASTSTNANIIGLYIGNGLTNSQNNMIALGSGLTTAVNMSGIRKSNTKANNFYHNTVVLSGSEVGVAGTTNTFAFLKTGSPTSPAVDVLQNNIFINIRSNASGNTQKHYVINVEGTGALTSDNNNLYANGVGAVLGVVGISPTTTDYATLAAWKTGTSKDAASVSKSVEFTSGTDLSITGTSVNDAELGAPRLATVLTDIIAASRATTTYMGAHEASDLTIPAPTKAFTVTVPNGTAKVYVAGTFTGKKWDITSPHELTATANPNEFTGTFACANDVAYKYLCEKNDWDYQEAAYNGSNPPVTGSNRTYNASDVVPIWYRVKSVKLNVSFATSAVPTQLFVKGGWDSWATPIELTKSGSTFSTTISGVLSDKIPANTQYKFYTNDMNTDNWESNADGSGSDNRWSISPVMNDVIARFTTQIITKLDNAKTQARIIRTASGIEVQLNGLSNIELLNVNGVLIDKTISNSTYSRKLDNGIYILKINGLATKFIK